RQMAEGLVGTFEGRTRPMLDDLVILARLGRDLPGWLRRPITVDQAREWVRDGLARRGPNFLHLVQRTVYANRRSPYPALLAHIGCEPGDLRSLVAREGLEPALQVLRDQGVYVTYEELKGRRPIVRGSLRLSQRAADFDNPLTRAQIPKQTGGSGGRPIPIR